MLSLPYKVSHLAPTLFAIFTLFSRCDVIADKAHCAGVLPTYGKGKREMRHITVVSVADLLSFEVLDYEISFRGSLCEV